jgi:hypothetical protein
VNHPIYPPGNLEDHQPYLTEVHSELATLLVLAQPSAILSSLLHRLLQLLTPKQPACLLLLRQLTSRRIRHTSQHQALHRKLAVTARHLHRMTSSLTPRLHSST